MRIETARLLVLRILTNILFFVKLHAEYVIKDTQIRPPSNAPGAQNIGEDLSSYEIVMYYFKSVLNQLTPHANSGSKDRDLNILGKKTNEVPNLYRIQVISLAFEIIGIFKDLVHVFEDLMIGPGKIRANGYRRSFRELNFSTHIIAYFQADGSKQCGWDRFYLRHF